MNCTQAIVVAGFVAAAICHGTGTAAEEAGPPPGVTFVVAPAGDDANPGTLEKPFATLERARDAAVAARAKGPKGIAVAVELRGGSYFRKLPFVLVKQDSGTKDQPAIYRAHGDEKPILYGGERVGGFERVPGEPETYVVDVTKYELEGMSLTQLFRLRPDGTVERLTRARHPNADPGDPIRDGWMSASSTGTAQGGEKATDESRRTLTLADGPVRTWKKPAEGFVNIFVGHQSWNDLLGIGSQAADGRTLTLAADCPRPVRAGDRLFVEGLREELDAPGEWYLDVDVGKLFVRPPVDVTAPEQLTVLLPLGRAILVLARQTEHVTIRGLTFRASQGSALVLNRVKHCSVVGCTIEEVGDYHGAGVSADGGESNLVEGCDISRTGGHGIRLDGGDWEALQALRPAGNRAVNNVVHHPGVIYKQGAGIALTGAGNTAARNLIHDSPRMGIMAGGNDHTIELNVVRRTNRETEDSAAIYVAGRDFLSGRGIVIRHNLLEDTGGLRREPDARWVAGEETVGILLDTHASGVDVVGNVIVRASRAGIRIENGRSNRIIDNLLCESGSKPVVEVRHWPADDPRWQRDLQALGWRFDKMATHAAWKKLRAMDQSPKQCIAKHGTTCLDNVDQGNESAARVPDAATLEARGLAVTNLGPYPDECRASWPIAESILPVPSTP